MKLKQKLKMKRNTLQVMMVIEESTEDIVMWKTTNGLI